MPGWWGYSQPIVPGAASSVPRNGVERGECRLKRLGDANEALVV
jgi:hypothetical protein